MRSRYCISHREFTVFQIRFVDRVVRKRRCRRSVGILDKVSIVVIIILDYRGVRSVVHYELIKAYVFGVGK